MAAPHLMQELFAVHKIWHSVILVCITWCIAAPEECSRGTDMSCTLTRCVLMGCLQWFSFVAKVYFISITSTLVCLFFLFIILLLFPSYQDATECRHVFPSGIWDGTSKSLKGKREPLLESEQETHKYIISLPCSCSCENQDY